MGVSKGVKSGTITPVFCGDALLMRGMEQFMDGLCWLGPLRRGEGRGNRPGRGRQPCGALCQRGRRRGRHCL